MASGSKPSTRNPEARGDQPRKRASCSSHHRRAASASGGWWRIDHWCWTAAIGRDGGAPLQQVDVVVGEADVADLALGHQVGHRADRLLDRHVGVRVVQLEHVDPVRAEAGQAGLEVRPDRRRRPVVGPGAVGAPDRAALGEDRDLVPAAAHGLADDLLGATPSVERRGVDPRDAGVEGGPDRRHRGRPVLRPPPEWSVLRRAERRRAQPDPAAEVHAAFCAPPAA